MVSKTEHGIDIRYLTPDEGQALLDAAARRHLDMSADEFVRKWESGAFDDDPEEPDVQRVAMLLPFGRQD